MAKCFSLKIQLMKKNNAYETEIKSIDETGLIQTWANGKGINSNLTVAGDDLYFTANDIKTKKNATFFSQFSWRCR